jgi:hypothetical protein
MNVWRRHTVPPKMLACGVVVFAWFAQGVCENGCPPSGSWAWTTLALIPPLFLFWYSRRGGRAYGIALAWSILSLASAFVAIAAA